MAKFELEGIGQDGRPKWLTYPCQAKGADDSDRCRISINGQRNGSGATWSVNNAETEGPTSNPDVSPSIKCGDSFCHFHIRHGRFEYCGDHKGRRDG